MESKYFWNKRQIATYFLSVLVLWTHCSSVSNYQNTTGLIDFIFTLLQYTLNNVAVPLFFIISGALFFRNYTRTLKCYKEKLSRRVKSLIIPYLLWNIINMLFNIFASMFFSKYFIGRRLFEFNWQNIIYGIFHYEYNGVFWFVFALIVFSVLSPLLDILLYSKLTGILSITVITALCYWDIGLPQPLFYSKNCIVFYLVGGLIGRFYFDYFSKKSSLKLQVPSLLLLVLGTVYFVLVRYKYITENIVINTVILILLSLSLWMFFDLFMSEKTSAPKFTKHSFWVFATHLNMSAVFTKLLYIVLPKSNYFSMVNFILTTVLTLCAVEVICFTVEKVSPKLYAALSGGRV